MLVRLTQRVYRKVYPSSASFKHLNEKGMISEQYWYERLPMDEAQ